MFHFWPYQLAIGLLFLPTLSCGDSYCFIAGKWTFLLFNSDLALSPVSLPLSKGEWFLDTVKLYLVFARSFSISKSLALYLFVTLGWKLGFVFIISFVLALTSIVRNAKPPGLASWFFVVNEPVLNLWLMVPLGGLLYCFASFTIP